MPSLQEQQLPSARKQVLVQQIVRGRLPEPAALRRAGWAEFLRPDLVRACALLFGCEGSEEDRAPHVLTRLLRVDLRQLLDGGCEKHGRLFSAASFENVRDGDEGHLSFLTTSGLQLVVGRVR